MICPVNSKSKWKRSADDDLIALTTGSGPFYVKKEILESIVHGVRNREVIHLSGGTGTGKSTLGNILPRNWRSLCSNMGMDYQSLKVFTIPLVHYQGPDELFTRRAIAENRTLDEDQPPLKAAKEAMSLNDDHDIIMWFQELGRTHTSVQHALVTSFLNDQVYDHRGQNLGSLNACILMDSNYQDREGGNYLLHDLDGALQSRFTLQLTLGYLEMQREKEILRKMISIPEEELGRLLDFTHFLRAKKQEGEYKSVPFPTFRQYKALGRWVRRPRYQIKAAITTIFFGGASVSEKNGLVQVLNQYFKDVDSDSSTKTS